MVDECHGGGLLVQRHCPVLAVVNRMCTCWVSRVHANLNIQGCKILQILGCKNLVSTWWDTAACTSSPHLIHPLATRPGSTIGYKSPSSIPPSKRDNH